MVKRNALLGGAARVMFPEFGGFPGFRGPRVCYAPDDGTGGGADPASAPPADPAIPPADPAPATPPPADPAAPGGGLLDKSKHAPASPDPAPADPTGKPTRPDHIPEKFWDAEKGEVRAEALAKSYTELERKQGQGNKAPAKVEDYKLEPSEGLKKLGVTGYDANDPVIPVFLKAAHEAGLSNEQANKLAGAVMEFAAGQDIGVDPAVIVDREFKKLGENAQNIIDGVDGWLHGLKSNGILSPEELGEARFMAGTAMGARVMVKLMEMTGEAPIPIKNAPVDGVPSAEEVYKMAADPKYGSDATFTKKVDSYFEAIFGTQPAGSSPAGLGVR